MIRRAVIFLGFAVAVSVSGQPAGMDLYPWWLSFESPVLESLIHQSLTHHPEAKSALSKLRATDDQRAEIVSQGQPALNLQAGYRLGRERSMQTGFESDDIDPLTARARMSWELDLFNRIEQEVTAGEAMVEFALQTVNDIQLSLSLDVALALFDVLLYRQQTDILLRQVHAATEIVDRLEQKMNSGLSDRSALHRAKADLEQRVHLYMGSDTQLDLAMAQLKSVVGADLEWPEGLGLVDFPLPDVPTAFSPDTEVYRPDLAAAWANVLAAQAESVSAERSRLPRLSLVASAAGERDVSGETEEWSAWVGPVIDLPIWEPGLKHRSRRKQAEANVAQADFERISLRAVREMDRAWALRRRADAMKMHMRSQYDELQQRAETQRRKRRAGLISEEEYRLAEIDAAQAEIGKWRWACEALKAHVQLLRAFGGRLSDPET